MLHWIAGECHKHTTSASKDMSKQIQVVKKKNLPRVATSHNYIIYEHCIVAISNIQYQSEAQESKEALG